MEDLVLSCLESRVEENRNLYARFLVGPFLRGDALTVATALRRVLLSSVESVAITALSIQGITHEFSTIVGVRESVLELSLNFGAIVLSYDKTFFEKKSFFDTLQIGYLQVQGPQVVYANHLKLPLGVKLVDPTQYLATVSKEGSLVLKFTIGRRDNNQNIGPESHFGNKAEELQIVGEIGKKNIANAKKKCSYKNSCTIDSFSSMRTKPRFLKSHTRGTQGLYSFRANKGLQKKALYRFPKTYKAPLCNTLDKDIQRKTKSFGLLVQGKTRPSYSNLSHKAKAVNFKAWFFQSKQNKLDKSFTGPKIESFKQRNPLTKLRFVQALRKWRNSYKAKLCKPCVFSLSKGGAEALQLKNVKNESLSKGCNLKQTFKPQQAIEVPVRNRMRATLFFPFTIKSWRKNKQVQIVSNKVKVEPIESFAPTNPSSTKRSFVRSSCGALCVTGRTKRSFVKHALQARKIKAFLCNIRKNREDSASQKEGLLNKSGFLRSLFRQTLYEQKKLRFVSNTNVFTPTTCLRNVIPLDLTLTPVLKVNFVVEVDDEVLYLRQKIRERIVLEVWTNGSIHPRQAVHDSSLRLLDMFASFRSVYQVRPT